MIANTDDDPAFIRAITTPKRGIGNSTLEKLANYAAAHHISLFAAAFESGMVQQIQERQHEDLMTFCNFINRMQAHTEKTSCRTNAAKPRNRSKKNAA